MKIDITSIPGSWEEELKRMPWMKCETFPSTSTSQVCNCIGPQNGEPVCPCQMRHVVIRNGHYFLDLGPVKGI